MIRVYIGYEERQAAAFHAAASSIIARSSAPVSISPISLRHVEGFFSRKREETQSTEFSFTRFLTPALAGFDGWAIYLDPDVVLTDDIAKLWALKDERYAVLCVKHEHKPVAAKKSFGERQLPYARKNWSSVMLMNCGACRALTPAYVERAPGLDLHQFKWVEDDKVGTLPKRWNHLVDYDPALPVRDISLLHFTNGCPNVPGYENCGYAEVWLAEQKRAA